MNRKYVAMGFIIHENVTTSGFNMGHIPSMGYFYEGDILKFERLIHNFTTTTASEEYFPVTMEEVRKIYLNRKYMYLLEGKELDKYLMTKELLK